MPAKPFDSLPDASRLWVFGASRALTETEQSHILGAVDEFLVSWNAHGTPVHAGRRLERGQFLLIGADEAASGLSGCSIDAMVRVLKMLEHTMGTSLVDVSGVFYEDGSDVAYVTRAEFKELARTGRVTADTTVFDMTAETVGDLRGGRWSARAADTWHGAAFFPEEVKA